MRKTNRISLLRAPVVAALATIAVVAAAAHGAGAASRGATAVQVTDAAPSWSPTGKQIAFSSQVNGLWQIYTVNAGGGGRRQLTSGNLASIDLAWSPTGKQIAFSRVVDGQVITSGHVYVIDANGGGLHEVTSGGGGYDEFLDWSPDGTTLDFDRVTNGIGAIYTVGVGGGEPARADTQLRTTTTTGASGRRTARRSPSTARARAPSATSG